MSDFISGVVGKFSFSVTWIFAAALAIGAATVFLIPVGLQLGFANQVGRVSTGGAVLFFSLAVTGAGVAMGIVSTPLYQVLEGYRCWSRQLRRAGIERHRRMKQALELELSYLDESEGLERDLLLERLSRYPWDEAQIAPTLFGNAMRRLETYGMDHYRIDAMTLWSELYTVVPKDLQSEVAGSRVGIDFFVAMVYLTVAYGLVALGLAVAENIRSPHSVDWGLAIEGVTVLVVGPVVSYRGALAAVDYYSSAVQALVNLGRPKLAEALRLNIPSTITEEQRMWELLTAFVNDPDNEEAATQLDAFRAGFQPRGIVRRLLHRARWADAKRTSTEVAPHG